MKNAILNRWKSVLAEKRSEPAVWHPDGSPACTFEGLEREALRQASALGPWAGRVVSLQLANSAAWPAAALGAWKAGCCVLLVDHTLADADRDEVERLCGSAARIGAAGVEPLDFGTVDFGAHCPDLIKLTSGTSGAPRAILFTAGQLAADCDQVCRTMGIHADDKNYGVVAFSHSYGFSSLVTPLLCRGVPLVAARDMLPRAVVEGVNASGATVLPAVPAVFRAMSELQAALPLLRLCISAGAPLEPPVADAFRARFGIKIHTFYGASECGGITYDAGEGEMPARGFVGRALEGVEIVPLEDGAIRVRSSAAGLGFFPGEEGDSLLAGEFQPPDLLEAAPEGWVITGRISDTINVAGRKVNPGAVETVLLQYPAVRQAVVFGVADSSRAQSVWACVVGDVDGASLRAFCASRLAAWQIPRAIVPVEEIPVNARGKISRADLAKRFGAAPRDS